jgi:hypothetical protein
VKQYYVTEMTLAEAKRIVRTSLVEEAQDEIGEEKADPVFDEACSVLGEDRLADILYRYITGRVRKTGRSE